MHFVGSSAHISQTAVPVLGAEKRKVRVVNDESLDMELGEEALEAKAVSHIVVSFLQCLLLLTEDVILYLLAIKVERRRRGR